MLVIRLEGAASVAMIFRYCYLSARAAAGRSRRLSCNSRCRGETRAAPPEGFLLTGATMLALPPTKRLIGSHKNNFSQVLEESCKGEPVRRGSVACLAAAGDLGEPYARDPPSARTRAAGLHHLLLRGADNR
jgi:hypothetical protein